LTAGIQLGPYEILSLLGTGGMGEVYRAHDTKLHREVALKVLPSEFASDPERMGRFKREAQLLASLNHPNIAAIYGLEEGAGVRALVMELAEGPTLAERISHGPIPLGEALPLARQIAEALEAAHEKGIIHRDLKPANILVGLDLEPKLLDFGLAMDLAGHERLSRIGEIAGTPEYLSPEQASGAEKLDARSDVFSLGTVLYELLTGEAPFRGQPVQDLLRRIREEDPVLPRRRDSRIPRDLQTSA